MHPSVLLLLCLALLPHPQAAGGARPPQGLPLKHSSQAHEKQLLEELQDVLEKLQSKAIATWEKKYNQVPQAFLTAPIGWNRGQWEQQEVWNQCSVGAVCAVRKGARIGRLCDCPRRATCNALLLKCL